MVYKFFDKNFKGSGIKHINTKLIPQNEQLAAELHKPIIRKFKKKKSISRIQRQYLGCRSSRYAINK